MSDDFLRAALGSTDRAVFRLGLSGSYNPGEAAQRQGIDTGMNYLFWYYWLGQMTRVLREVPPAARERLLVATGVANVPDWTVRRAPWRHQLHRPNVHVCLTAPRSARELEENLAAVARGPRSEEELSFMRRFGDAVHAQSRFFSERNSSCSVCCCSPSRCRWPPGNCQRPRSPAMDSISTTASPAPAGR
jgi:hypothetical protein